MMVVVNYPYRLLLPQNKKSLLILPANKYFYSNLCAYNRWPVGILLLFHPHQTFTATIIQT